MKHGLMMITFPVWQALYILPTYQRKGIGTALIRWAFDAYDLSKHDMYLQTAHAMMLFYQKLGWRNVGATEVDLAHWGGEGMGFGVHRTDHMNRVPRVES
jgi:GNAT superfamily N-acetyltransferase